MTNEKLYDLAFKFKKTKLWNQLSDTDLFALPLSNGETGYVCIMGQLGDHFALALYVGNEGLDSYRNIAEFELARTEAEYNEIMVSQNCIQCAFESKSDLAPQELEELYGYAKAHGITFKGKNAYPQFKVYRPYRFPWFLRDEEDRQLLYEALSAALALADKLKTSDMRSLGFIGTEPYGRSIPLLQAEGGGYKFSMTELPPRLKTEFPSPLLRDELLAARLKRKKKIPSGWVCEVLMVPNPVRHKDDESDFPEEAPVFPFILLIVDNSTGMLLPSDLVMDYIENPGSIIEILAEHMEKEGVPSELLVRDRRTEALLGSFAQQIGVKLTFRSDLPILDEVEESLFDHFSGRHEDGEPEDVIGDLLELLSELSDEELKTIPAELKKQLIEMDKQGLLPGGLSMRFKRVFKY